MPPKCRPSVASVPSQCRPSAASVPPQCRLGAIGNLVYDRILSSTHRIDKSCDGGEQRPSTERSPKFFVAQNFGNSGYPLSNIHLSHLKASATLRSRFLDGLGMLLSVFWIWSCCRCVTSVVLLSWFSKWFSLDCNNLSSIKL